MKTKILFSLLLLMSLNLYAQVQSPIPIPSVKTKTQKKNTPLILPFQQTFDTESEYNTFIDLGFEVEKGRFASTNNENYLQLDKEGLIYSPLIVAIDYKTLEFEFNLKSPSPTTDFDLYISQDFGQTFQHVKSINVSSSTWQNSKVSINLDFVHSSHILIALKADEKEVNIKNFKIDFTENENAQYTCKQVLTSFGFLDGGDIHYDKSQRMVDDILLPAGLGGLEMHKLVFNAMTDSEIQFLEIRLYNDDNNKPGELYHQPLKIDNFSTKKIGELYGMNIYEVSLLFDKPIFLVGGATDTKYWLQIKAKVPSLDKRVFWEYNYSASVGSPSLFYNDNSANWSSTNYENVFSILGKCYSQPLYSPIKGVKFENVTETTVSLTWDKNNATNWEIAFGEYGFDLNTSQNKIKVNQNNHTITDLTEAKYYQFYIRVINNNSDEQWTGPFTINTLCQVANIPYSLDFNDTPDNLFPPCTKTENKGSANNWTIAINPALDGINSKALQYRYHETAKANAWFFTNAFYLNKDVQYSISYKYMNKEEDFVEKFKVLIGQQQEEEGMTLLADHNNVSDGILKHNTVHFTPTNSGVYYLGFHVYSNPYEWMLFIDDILVESDLSTNNPETITTEIFPNPATNKLNITSDSSIKEVKIYNLIGQLLISKSYKNSNKTSINIESLLPGSYIISIIDQNKTTKKNFIKK